MSFDPPLFDLTPSLSDSTPASSGMNSTLESLRQYTPRQTKAIESLLDPSFSGRYFRNPSDTEWFQFWESAWGNGPGIFEETEKVERGPDPIDDTLIDVPPDRDVMVVPEVTRCFWDFDFDFTKILVRSDYKEAEEFALSICGAPVMHRMLLVSGQPGIGLSLF